MAVNLLPPELRPKGYFLALSKKLKKISLISVILLLVVGSTMLASVLFLKYQVSSSLKRQDKLKSNIKALEQTEQKVVLIRDRLQNINEIAKSENINKEVDVLEDVVNVVKGNTRLAEVELKPSGADIVLVAGNSLDLTRFLADLTSQVELVKLELISLDFSPIKGYQMKLSLIR